MAQRFVAVRQVYVPKNMKSPTNGMQKTWQIVDLTTNEVIALVPKIQCCALWAQRVADLLEAAHQKLMEGN